MSRTLSRRHFLGRSATLAGALALSWALPTGAAQASGATRPVLLVHGFGDRAAVWQRSDNALVGRLIQAGLAPGAGLEPFRYPALPGLPGTEDSQGDIAAAGLVLAQAIRTAADRSADGQVDLLGFSMGGLVSRWAINHLRQTVSSVRPLVNTAVMVGSPNNGADILVVLGQLNPGGRDALVELARDLAGLDLDSLAAHQMLPRSAFLAELNQNTRADERVRYVTVAGSVTLHVRVWTMTTSVEIGDGLILAASAAYLPGLRTRSYVLTDELGVDGQALLPAIRRSRAFHGGLLFNDTVSLAVAAELVPGEPSLRAELDRSLESSQIGLVAGA